MSDERHETVADIMSEMREYADEMEKHLLYDLRKCATDYLRILADRIETAVNHQFREAAKMIPHEEVAVSKMETTTPTSEKSSAVGNAAAMRESIAKCVDMITRFGNAEIIKDPLDVIIDIDGILKSTLSAPPRNCDVGTEQEQFERFDRWCNSRVLKNCWGLDCRKCFIAWSQMQYEEVK